MTKSGGPVVPDFCAMAQARFIIRTNARVVFFLIDFVF